MKSSTNASFSSLPRHEGSIDSDNTKRHSTRRRVAGIALSVTALVSGCTPSKAAAPSTSSIELPSASSVKNAPTAEAPSTTTTEDPIVASTDNAVGPRVSPSGCPITASQAHEIAGTAAHLLKPDPNAEYPVRCAFGVEPGLNSKGQPNILDYASVVISDISVFDFSNGATYATQNSPDVSLKYSPEYGPGAWETWEKDNVVIGPNAVIQMPWHGEYIMVAVMEPRNSSIDPHTAADQLGKLIVKER